MNKLIFWTIRGVVAVVALSSGLALAGCSAMTGEALGVSVNVGGFQVGLSGKIPDFSK